MYTLSNKMVHGDLSNHCHTLFYLTLNDIICCTHEKQHHKLKDGCIIEFTKYQHLLNQFIMLSKI